MHSFAYRVHHVGTEHRHYEGGMLRELDMADRLRSIQEALRCTVYHTWCTPTPYTLHQVHC